MNDIVIYTDAGGFENNVLKSELPVTVYFYSEDCPPCEALSPMFKRLAEKYGQAMRFVGIFRQQNRELAEKLGVKSSPTLLFFSKGKEVCSRLTGYISNPELSRAVETAIGGNCPPIEKKRVDSKVLILGAGPAGLSAAIYSSRAKLETVVVDEGIPGGQAATTFHVANYPGTNGVVRGTDLMENMKNQALSFGTRIDDLKQVYEVNLEGEEKHIRTEDTDYYVRSVIIATGASPRRLPAEGEREYRGRGVHYCTTCDGALYQDADVLVIGGGDSAVEGAVFMTRYARHVTLIHRSDRLKASPSAQEEALRNPNISVVWDSEVQRVIGDNFVKSVEIKNVRTGAVSSINADGVFVHIGTEPKTGLFKGKVAISSEGYINTDEDMKTNIPGIFAAGDVRNKKIRQIANAVGDGVIAGIMAERYVSGKY